MLRRPLERDVLVDVEQMDAPAIDSASNEAVLARWHAWIMAGDAHASPAPRPHHTRRVLLLSYQFPPTGGSGVQRPAKLARYLPANGWNVDVLAAAHDRFPWTDPTLATELPDGVNVHRIAGFEPACLARRAARGLCWWLPPAGRRWIEDRLYWRLIRMTAARGLGNGEPLWVSAAVRAALRLHRRNPFDVILSTGPPHFVHEAALRIHKAAGLPWVADLRDPLVSDFDRTAPDTAMTATMRRLEDEILQHAAVVVTTCAAFADDLRARYPHRPAGSIRAITNGFDRDDLRRAFAGQSVAPVIRGAGILPAFWTQQSPRPQNDTAPPQQILTPADGGAGILPAFWAQQAIRLRNNTVSREGIPVSAGCEKGFSHQGFSHQHPSHQPECRFVAAGSLYGRREIDRLVEPLRRVLDAHPEWHGRIHLILAGSIDARQRQRWEHDRPEWLTLTGYVDHAEALRITASATCNIIMVPDCAHGRLSIPGKTFELIALPAHILALAPETGDTARIVREAGAATVVPLEATDRVATAMARIITAHFAGRLERERAWPTLERYERRAIAQSFAECLTFACAEALR